VKPDKEKHNAATKQSVEKAKKRKINSRIVAFFPQWNQPKIAPMEAIMDAWNRSHKLLALSREAHEPRVESGAQSRKNGIQTIYETGCSGSK
jgi:hypothetical protein